MSASVTSPTLAPRTERLERLARHFAETVVPVASDTQLAVRRAGDASAPAVVLLHGIGSGAASWFDVAMALGDARQVIAWDAPGYGASTPLPTIRPKAADFAVRLETLFRALDIRRCTLVGHSLGALVATAFAAGPGRGTVDRLVLVSPARGYGDSGDEATRVRTARLDDLRHLGIPGLADRAPDRMLTPQADADARAWVRWNTARLNPAGYAQAVELLCGDSLAAHADLSMPVEVHCGDADAVTPPAGCEAAADALGASFALIARAGHASPVEQPAAVARCIWPKVSR